MALKQLGDEIMKKDYLGYFKRCVEHIPEDLSEYGHWSSC
jgi:hypothetical protein